MTRTALMTSDRALVAVMSFWILAGVSAMTVAGIRTVVDYKEARRG
ncbi:MAG: hypothetical protein P1U38_09520 [Aeromicrobium sp.]|nr:hypothetical protein [Aeromicrobium sp.]MDF1704999.1 hypothetical protein [Aeromicrobium sp.]